MSRPALAQRLPALALAALLLPGCTQPIPVLILNQPPSVNFTLAPVSADPNDPVFYAYKVYWSGDDPDGRVDHFDYAIDPGPLDTAWVSTTRSEETLFFRSTTDDGRAGPVRHARDYHVLVLRAVDNQGAMSARKTRAFYSYTVAPSVEVVAPHPSGLLEVQVPPSFSVNWQGADPDGQIANRPVRYRIRLQPFDITRDQWMLSDPDSLFRRERAAGFAGWDSTAADTTFARYTNLTPRNHYLFLVVAVDEAGALSPLFSMNENMLRLECNPAATLGPRIHVFNSYLDFTYDSGGYTVDELRWIRLDAPAGQPIPFNWEAFTSAGAHIERYRWGVDLASVADETPRSDEVHDYSHWSRGGALELSCTLAGLSPGLHLLYIEAKDNNGYASLGIVAVTLVVPTFANDLLVVNDTRFEVDKFLAPGRLDTYKGRWPSATELDTFLFARGGVPWRSTQDGSPDLRSPAGVFAGYAYDTLGTRLGREFPSLGVRLGDIGKYKHVVWMVDAIASGYQDVLGALPVTVLRYASSPGRASALGAYVQAGGSVWLMGGGAGTASIVGFNSNRNDGPNGQVYSNQQGELVSGRLMFDGAHWRSSFSATSALISFQRSPAAEAIAARPWSHADRWTGGEVHAPDYLELPEEMRPRDPATDPIPPTRTARQGSLYYRTGYPCEYLIEPNVITEDVDPNPNPGHVKIASTLDTLYEGSSLLMLRSPAPTMTYYHGSEANRFVFTGFAPWDFRRDDAIALTDFVLHDIWGLARQPVDRGLVRGGAAGRPGAAGVRAARGTATGRTGYE